MSTLKDINVGNIISTPCTNINALLSNIKNEQGVKKVLNEHAEKLDIPHAKLSRNPRCLQRRSVPVLISNSNANIFET